MSHYNDGVCKLEDFTDRAYDDRLGCFIDNLTYDYRAKCGYVYLPGMACTDMTGCIGLFMFIDASVERIIAMSGSDWVVYQRHDDDRWSAIDSDANVTKPFVVKTGAGVRH